MTNWFAEHYIGANANVLDHELKSIFGDLFDPTDIATQWEFNAPKGHLISGLAFKYYSDDYVLNPQCGRYTPGCESKYNTNITHATILELMVDLETVYVSNPLDPIQRYRPIRVNNRSDQTDSLQESGILEVKFDKGYYLIDIREYTVGNGNNARYGFTLLTSKISGLRKSYTMEESESKKYDIGSLIHDTAKKSVNNTNFELISNFLVNFGTGIPADRDHIMWMTKLAGNTCTKNKYNLDGQHFTMHLSNLIKLEPVYEIYYSGDSVYNCCFGVVSGCKYDMSKCDQVKKDWCRDNKNDPKCNDKIEFMTGYKPIGKKKCANSETVDTLVIIFIVVLFIAMVTSWIRTFKKTKDKSNTWNQENSSSKPKT